MISETISKAARSAKVARALLDGGDFDDAVSRAYYSAFNTARALVAMKNPEYATRTHGGTLGEFSRLFIKTGLLPKEFGQRINRAESARKIADYEGDVIDGVEAEKHVSFADELLVLVALVGVAIELVVFQRKWRHSPEVVLVRLLWRIQRHQHCRTASAQPVVLGHGHEHERWTARLDDEDGLGFRRIQDVGGLIAQLLSAEILHRIEMLSGREHRCRHPAAPTVVGRQEDANF